MMSALLKVLTLSFLALMPIVTNAYVVWWKLASLSSVENDVERLALSPKQFKIIHNNDLQLVGIIGKGAKEGITECQRQFKHRRWNCSSNSPYTVFGNILKIACRETAFVYAITAAGVSHSISRACSNSDLKICTCDNHYRAGKVTKEGWQWGGCSDNIRFADKLARKFLKAGEKYQDFRAYLNMHNNEAGMAAVRNNMIRECKCHGPSNACTVRTCWRRIPNFQKVGKELKEKFDGASKVEIEQNSQKTGKKIPFTPVNKLHKPPTQADLVYYEESPDFCRKNVKVGSLGTVGRECNESSLGTDGCDLLCCGRGFQGEWRIQAKPCNCKFFWCCQVKCATCNERKNVRTCL